MPNELPSRPRTVSVTLEVPAERQEAFMRLWREFASGETPQDEAIRQRACDREQGIASLQALVKVAQAGNFGCKVTKAAGFRIYLPGDRAAEFAPYAVDACTGASVHQLSVRPFNT